MSIDQIILLWSRLSKIPREASRYNTLNLHIIKIELIHNFFFINISVRKKKL